MKSSSALNEINARTPPLEEELARIVMERCDALAACSDHEGQILRTFLSPAMERCNQLTATWMEAAGMSVSIDTVGNLHGVYEASQPEAPRLVLGSHLDTVPNAGKYDGILGVVLAIALIDSFQGKHLPFAIEVIGFADEEGVRFGLPFIGSRAVAGELDDAHLQMADADGISLRDALHTFSASHPHATASKLDHRTCAYLEFHIEQGPVLEDAEQALGIVEAIAGQSRAKLTFLGAAGHAGTTPMALRRDALMAAAEWMLAVEATAIAMSGLVATTGWIICEPGAGNIIPGLVRCSLDVRSADDEVRHRSLESMLSAAQTIAKRRDIQVSHTLETDQPTAPLHASLTRLAQQAVASTQTLAKLMVSGAGHDAMIFAPHIPTAMIFLRSPGGISHHPDEAVHSADVAAALRAGIHFLQHFAAWIESEHRA